MIASPRAQSFAEPARFVYLEGVLFSVFGREKATNKDDWPTDFDCEHAPDYQEMRRIGNREEQAMRDDARATMTAWRKDLKARLGDGYQAEMQRATKLLVAHKMRDPLFGENSLYD